MLPRRIKVKQRDITDCGAACLSSVGAYYQMHVSIGRVRQYAGTDKRGTNILGLIEAAEKLGLEAKGVRGTYDSLFKIPKPAIAHVVLENGLHHYVVIYKCTKRCIFIMDPADGVVHRKTHDAFRQQWSGVLMLLVPGSTFQKGTSGSGHAGRFWQLMRPHSGVLLQALVGALVYTVLGLSTSIYVQKLVDFVLVEGNVRLLNLLSVIMVALLLFQVMIGYIKTVMALKVGQQIDARLILGYYRHLFTLPQRFFDTMRVGEITSRISDAVKIRLFINKVALSLIVNIFIIGFAFAIMFLYYWKLALILLAIVPVYAILYAVSNRVNKKWQRKLMEKGAALETQLVESLNASGTIKRFGLEAHAQSKTEDRFVELLRSVYKSSLYGLQLNTFSEWVTRLFTIIILWAGSYFVINRELSPGELLSFYALIAYFTGPATALIGANRSIQDALIAADRLFEIIDLEQEISGQHRVVMTPEQAGDIAFGNVSFRYGTREWVLKGLSFDIQKGQSVAIVGESGSGKSTVLSLLQNLYTINEGQITIGGADIQYIDPASLRRLVGVVPQQVDLFAGTILENIAIGDPQPDVHKMLMLCRQLGIHDFIAQLPLQYDTILNEQGANLSGGQRQRIAIARALYRDPEILILDEATSSLDPLAEARVQEVLDTFRQQGKTLIIIAHRLSTIVNCDKIMLLQNGQLAEQGTHEELLALEGLYSQLWNLNKAVLN
jgi:ATP-binding cassette subfamily B protein